MKTTWKRVPVECTDDIAEAIAHRARCCGGVAAEIWDAAMAASSLHLVGEDPHKVRRMKVCEPGYIGPANIEVVAASDYDALLAQLEDPQFPPKHARRLIAELRERIAVLEAEKVGRS